MTTLLPSPVATSSTRPTAFIIEDDPLMAECIARAVSPIAATRTFSDAISATNALADSLPDLILLDVLLDGPDGFTFLNEMISYPDTAKIPVILVTSLSLAEKNLIHYGIRTILDKNTMTPPEIQEVVCAVLFQNTTMTSENTSAPPITAVAGATNAC